MSIPNPPVIIPNFVEKVLTLTECVCAYLEAEGSGPTCWCGVYPGAQVSWAHCGDCGNDQCGMGYVRPGRMFPYDIFPQQSLDERCTKPLAMALEVGVARCMPTMEEDGSLPSPVDITNAAIELMLDQTALYQAVKCCADVGLVTVESWQPLGPSGGCVGGAWTVWIDANIATSA